MIHILIKEMHNKPNNHNSNNNNGHNALASSPWSPELICVCVHLIHIHEQIDMCIYMCIYIAYLYVYIHIYIYV